MSTLFDNQAHIPSLMPPKAPPLIKCYLPIRLIFPSNDHENPDETFFFIKEHFDSDKRTLFVTNAPFYPNVSTRVLLRSILGRYGELERVTVVENPRTKVRKMVNPLQWTTKTFLFPSYHQQLQMYQGKFAHAVFVSQKEMKKALTTLGEIMGATTTTSSDYEFPGVSVEKLEIQTLEDETRREFLGKDDDDFESDFIQGNALSGILAVADRYRKSLEAIPRDVILEECNRVMLEYEEAEEADRVARAQQSNVPDEDGFVTVSYSSQVGSKRELEEGVTTTNHRKGSKRSRSRKAVTGASELDDFYRFQQKDTRRRTVQELRKRFEEDLAKVKQMKEEKQFRPFS